MHWLNKYHKGFNRLWLVVSTVLALVVVGLNANTGEYVEPPTDKDNIYMKWRLDKAALHLLGAFIVTFTIGHGVFLVVWWIIRGFR